MIEFRNVSMTYKTGINALKNISFSVMDGEFLFIIGKSGSGKSTLIKLLTCEEDPSAGHVLIDDYEISFLRRGLIPYLRRNIGMVFQDFRLIYSKTVYENVAFAMEIIGASPRLIKRRVPIVLSIVGLRDKANVKSNQLSGGEQQRVSIARAMVNNPMLILADEPTGNLDPINSEAIMALLEQINSSGTTVIVCTHESNIVNKMRKRVIEISDGRLVRDEMTGEYNLANFTKNEQINKTKNQEVFPEKATNNKIPHKSVPFVRNINIKFSNSENEMVEVDDFKENEDKLDTKLAAKDLNNLDIEIHTDAKSTNEVIMDEKNPPDDFSLNKENHETNISDELIETFEDSKSYNQNQMDPPIQKLSNENIFKDNDELSAAKSDLNTIDITRPNENENSVTALGKDSSIKSESTVNSDIDFRDLIKPKRVGGQNSSEDNK